MRKAKDPTRYTFYSTEISQIFMRRYSKSVVFFFFFFFLMLKISLWVHKNNMILNKSITFGIGLKKIIDAPNKKLHPIKNYIA